jgi:hypothetical protein
LSGNHDTPGVLEKFTMLFLEKFSVLIFESPFSSADFGTSFPTVLFHERMPRAYRLEIRDNIVLQEPE